MKSGVPPPPHETQPGLSWLSSIVSPASFPKVGEPQTRMLSFEWNGPFTVSWVMKLISVHPEGLSWRGALQLAPAHAWSSVSL